MPCHKITGIGTHGGRVVRVSCEELYRSAMCLCHESCDAWIAVSVPSAMIIEITDIRFASMLSALRAIIAGARDISRLVPRFVFMD